MWLNIITIVFWNKIYYSMVCHSLPVRNHICHRLCLTPSCLSNVSESIVFTSPSFMQSFLFFKSSHIWSLNFHVLLFFIHLLIPFIYLSNFQNCSRDGVEEGGEFTAAQAPASQALRTVALCCKCTELRPTLMTKWCIWIDYSKCASRETTQITLSVYFSATILDVHSEHYPVNTKRI